MRLYLDGVLRASATDSAGSFTLGRPKMYLGRDGRTDLTRFDGYLDNVRISNVALTPLQFQMSSPGEQNYYRMETDGGLAVHTGQSASVVDDTGQHPFTYNGQAYGPRYSNDVVGSGILRDGVSMPNTHSLSFNGTSDYVELGDQPLLRTLPQEDFTIEFFLKTPPRSDRAILIGTYDNQAQYLLNLEIGGSVHGTNKGHLRAYLQGSGSANELWGNSNISDNQWHHVALVRSGAGTANDQIRLYVDYKLDGQMGLTTGQYTLRPTIFRLGRDIRDTGFYYEGLLDEFRIVRGALEVNQFLQAVPEPSSFILLMVGGVGMMVGVVGRLLPVRRRRQ